MVLCVCVCVCVHEREREREREREELDKVLLRILEGTGTTWKN